MFLHFKIFKYSIKYHQEKKEIFISMFNSSSSKDHCFLVIMRLILKIMHSTTASESGMMMKLVYKQFQEEIKQEQVIYYLSEQLWVTGGDSAISWRKAFFKKMHTINKRKTILENKRTLWKTKRQFQETKWRF